MDENVRKEFGMTKLEEVASAVLAEAYKTGGIFLSVVAAKAIARAAVGALKEPSEEVRDVLCKACPTYCFNGCDCGGVWDSGLDAILNEPTKES